MINFIIGNIYTNEQIYTELRCANTGGIRTSHTTKTIAIFTKYERDEKLNPYIDSSSKVSDVDLVYTGAGLEGDQSLKGLNMSLYNTKRSGTKTYLYKILYFVSTRSNEYTYMGEYVICGNYFFEREKDRNGNMRAVIKFPLKKV